MNLNDELLKNKNIILNKFKYDIDKYTSFLNAFGLDESNYSKALKSELAVFSEEIKNNEKLFTNFEKEGLIFIQNEDKEYNEFNISDGFLENYFKKLKLIKDKLNLMSIKLNHLKNSNELNPSLNNKSDNKDFETVFSKIEKILKEKVKNVTNDKFFNSGSKNDIERIKNLKSDISSIQEENYILKEERDKLDKQIKNYLNLPSDITKIKEMIYMKTIELENLN